MKNKLMKALAMTSVIFLFMFSSIGSAWADTAAFQSDRNDKADIKSSRALMYSGAALTTIGALTATAGAALGFPALIWLIDQGPNDSSGMIGGSALATLCTAVPFLAAGIPLLVIGKRKWTRMNQLSAFIPTPQIAMPADTQSVSGFTLQWRLSF